MDENIFETAGKMRKKKNQPENIKPPEKRIDKSSDSSNLTAGDMMQKIKGMREDLEGKLFDIYKKGSEKHINVDAIIDRYGGLAIKNLDKIKDQEQILNDKINAAIPPESCLKKKPKSKETLTQERKGKLRGLRNNWIPVR